MQQKIQILGQSVTVKYLETNSGGENGLFGEYCGASKSIHIYLDRCTTDALIHQTLRHEIFHACLDISGVGQIIKDKLEEAIVVALEHGCEGLLDITFQPKWKWKNGRQKQR
jgi:hypothetical protein